MQADVGEAVTVGVQVPAGVAMDDGEMGEREGLAGAVREGERLAPTLGAALDEGG